MYNYNVLTIIIYENILSCVLTIQQFAVIHCHSGYPANKLEVREVIFITQSGIRIYL